MYPHYAENPYTGLVSPLSNNAGNQSIFENYFKSDATSTEIIAHLDSINAHLQFAATQSKKSVQTPLPHGFALGVSADLIEDLGFLDSDHYPRGYGEENDYAIRAAKAGFFSRIALDVYIFHHGAASFTVKSKELLKKHARQVLDSCHSPRLVANLIDQTSHIHKIAIVPLRNRKKQRSL